MLLFSTDKRPTGACTQAQLHAPQYHSTVFLKEKGDARTALSLLKISQSQCMTQKERKKQKASSIWTKSQSALRDEAVRSGLSRLGNLQLFPPSIPRFCCACLSPRRYPSEMPIRSDQLPRSPRHASVIENFRDTRLVERSRKRKKERITSAKRAASTRSRLTCHEMRKESKQRSPTHLS